MIDRIVEFLSRQRYAVVSTIEASGSPQSALVGIAWWRATMGCPELVFDTTSSTRKAKNLRHNPRCSVVIGWENETTVQVDGLGRLLGGEELVTAKLDYFRVWPECRAHESWPEIAYFSIQPQWLRYSCYLGDRTVVEFTRQQLIDELENSPGINFSH